MPITIDMMKAAARSGLSVVCASCERYWEARGRGVTGDRCASDRACGSPLAEMDFPEYRGIMTEDAFRQFCFMCGDDAVATVRRRLSKRELGLCDKHLPLLREDRLKLSAVPHTAVPSGNYLGVDDAVLKGHALPPERSLLGTMLKTEKEWADKFGWEFRPLDLLGVRDGKD